VIIRRTCMFRGIASTLALFALGTAHAAAADVVVQPKAGSGLVVTDASGSQIRLRVNEGGEVTIPVLVNGAQQNLPACVSATGQLGPCAPGAIGSVGPQGPAGATGPIGATGPQGPAGTGSFALPYAGSAAVSGAAFAVTNSAKGDSVVGVSTDGAGVSGTSASYDGVYGQTTSFTAAGVEGFGGNSTIGVLGRGTGGPGVKGVSTSGYAMVADGATQQTLSKGGWVKAMVEVQPHGLGVIRCFNSQQNASVSGDVPCGFKYSYKGAGVTSIDFGFPIYDRFFSAIVAQACDGVCIINIYTEGDSTLNVQVFDSVQSTALTPIKFTDRNYYVIVY